MFETAVDGFDRPVGGADIDKCQDVGAPFVQASPELGQLFKPGLAKPAEPVDQPAHLRLRVSGSLCVRL